MDGPSPEPEPAAEGVREEDGVEMENRVQGGQKALLPDEEEEAARRRIEVHGAVRLTEVHGAAQLIEAGGVARRTEEREVLRRIEGRKEGLLGEAMVVQWLPTYSELPRRRGVEVGSGLEVAVIKEGEDADNHNHSRKRPEPSRQPQRTARGPK